MRLGKVQRHLTPTALFSLLPQQSDTWLALKGARADDLRWHAMLHRDSTQRCYCNCWSSSGTANSAQNMSFHTLCSHLYLYDYEYYNAHIDPTRRWDKSTCSHLSSWFSTNCSNMWREHELSANAESALKSFTNDSVGGHTPIPCSAGHTYLSATFSLTASSITGEKPADAVYHKSLMVSVPAPDQSGHT